MSTDNPEPSAAAAPDAARRSRVLRAGTYFGLALLAAAATWKLLQDDHGAPATAALAPPVASSRTADPLDQVDAAAAGWVTEVFYEEVKHQLSDLAKLLARPADLAEAPLAPLLAADFSCGALRPADLHEAFRDPAFSVQRAAEKPPGDTAFSGAAGLLEALRALASSHEVAGIQVELKTFKVALEGESGTSLSYYHATSRPTAGSVQQNALWSCSWLRPQGSEHPLLRSIAVTDFEEVRATAAGGRPFADCTASVLGGNPSYATQVVPGPSHWWGRTEAALGVHYYGHHGLAVGDVNGDGLDDLYLCQPGGMPNRLFVQQPDGTAKDVSEEAGVDWLDYSASALIADLDNDADQDLVVATYAGVLVHEGDGRGRFTKAAFIEMRPDPGALSAADPDADGDVDLYVTRYFDTAQALVPGSWTVPVPYHDASNGAPNVFLRNDGSLRFTDATAAVGLDQNNTRFSFQATWEDHDDDGDPDLYVANDFGRNNLYRNEGGRFRDVAAEAGVEDVSAGMGVTWGDYDADGRMDLHVSNMFSGAGNRITYQRKFRPGEDEATLALFRRHARGNSLFHNEGDGTFRDVSVEAGITMGRWAWASHFTDWNGDGREDILVANGYVTNENPRDL